MAYAQHVVAETLSRQERDLVLQKRFPAKGNHTLGDIREHFPDACAQSAGQDQSEQGEHRREILRGQEVV